VEPPGGPARLGDLVSRWPVFFVVGDAARHVAREAMPDAPPSVALRFGGGELEPVGGPGPALLRGRGVPFLLVDAGALSGDLLAAARRVLAPGGRLGAVGPAGDVDAALERARRSFGAALPFEVSGIRGLVAFDLIDTCPAGRPGWSARHGLGLFAARDVAAGETLMRLDGQVVPLDRVPFERVASVEWNAIQGHALLVRYHPTDYGLINHSRTPNAEVRTAERRVATVEPVREGTEITLDYRREPLPPEYLAHPPAYL